MGSRSRRYAPLRKGFGLRASGLGQTALALVFLAGCAIGAPPGFSSGDTWTVPLVDPLADGRLIVPVTVDGHGPYLFLLDRDSQTVVDGQIIRDTGVRVEGAIRLDDYHDTSHPAYTAELTNVQVGSLTISLVPVAIVGTGNVFDDDGRRIQGILGRDFLADSVVFGFDRDRGIAWVQTQEAFHPPPDATVLLTTKTSSQGTKIIYRPIVKDARVGDVPADLHVDFSMIPSQLVREKWHTGGLSPIDWGLDLVDESGTTRHVSRIGVAPRVSVGPITREGVGFVAYDDRRIWWYHLDGTLGLDFFRPYKVASDWHHEKLYLSPRRDVLEDLNVRLARWGAKIPACPHPGCVQVVLDDQWLRIRPDPGVATNLEVVLRATSANGNPLPMLYLNLPAGSPAFDDTVETRYLGAKIEVVDASPFPRLCPNGGACIMQQSRLPP